MKIGLIAIAGVKIQTRRFLELGVTLPQFVNRGQVIAQLPSLALLTLAGATPDGVEVEYIEVDDVIEHARDPRNDFDLGESHFLRPVHFGFDDVDAAQA